MTIRPARTELLHEDRQADRQKDRHIYILLILKRAYLFNTVVPELSVAAKIAAD
jgi:hypothetical protein